MARLRTGMLLHVWRAFGRVCFMVRWDTGERMTIIVPKRHIDPTLRAGERVGTVEPDPLPDGEDFLEQMAINAMPEGEAKHLRQQQMFARLQQRWEAQGRPEEDRPWERRYYQRA